MSIHVALVGGAVGGIFLGTMLVPLTRRELSAAIVRSTDGPAPGLDSSPKWQSSALIIASGSCPGRSWRGSGWSVLMLPLLVLMLGLVQLAYCDLTEFLLPRPMVHATTVAVTLSALGAAAWTGEWHRFAVAVAGGVGLFVLLFAINLMNSAWMAFGDVRLAPAVGVGLAWISPAALVRGFFLANVLAAVVGLLLMAMQRADRKTALPFGLYLAVGSAVVILLAA